MRKQFRTGTIGSDAPEQRIPCFDELEPRLLMAQSPLQPLAVVNTGQPGQSAVVSSTSTPAYTLAQTLSDQAQVTTLAFDGLAMMTGNLDAQSFFPPGKVADYFGFQYLRDNDPDNMGHNTSFLTRVADNVIYTLNSTQLAQMVTLASAQLDQVNLYAYERYPLMEAFRRLVDGSIPSGSSGLNLDAVKQASQQLYILDGQISFDRAVLYSNILNSLDSTQTAYLAAMKGEGFNSWPDVSDAQISSKLQGLPQGTMQLVMTYASDMFSWYAGSVTSDVYFCPERQGTYFGGFYIKDAPAVGHEGYSISEQLTATAGSALCDPSQGYVTQAQATLMSSLVDTQRNNLYAGTTNIVEVRTQISTLLRSLLTSTASSSSVKSQVLALSATYGDLDGEDNYNNANVFAQVYNTLTAGQKTKLAALRESIMSGNYSDGTPFDYSVCTTPFLYSDAITDTSVLAPYIASATSLFFEPSTPTAPTATTTTLQASGASAVYGTSVTFTASVNAASGLPTGTVTFLAGSTVLGTGTLDGTGKATFTISSLPVIAAGYAVSASYGGDSTFNTSVSQSVTLTVTPASLMITVDNKSKVYGQANPTLTATYTGLVNGDTAASMSATLVTAPANAAVGAYPINAHATSANYMIRYVAGTLTVTPAPLTITADNKSRVYGQPNPTLTASYAGLVNGDTTASVPVTLTTAPSNSGVGKYAISLRASNRNYNITCVTGKLTITPAALTIKANNQTKVYGAAMPALTASYSGFVNGDSLANLSVKPVLSTKATASSNVGSYAITVSGAVDPNYTITYVVGTLTITPAALKITANNQTKVYGAAIPVLTASYAGFVNGDTPACLSFQPVLTTTALASSNVGVYTITVSGAVDPNYTTTYVFGKLTITPAPKTNGSAGR